MPEPLLEVLNLSVRARSAPAIPALDNVSFQIQAGETFGILGESGAGKTTLAKVLIRLLPAETWNIDGSIRFQGQEILRAKERQLRHVRGSQMALISQEPELALNPVLTVGRQVDEVLRAHSHESRRDRREEVLEMLGEVGLADPRIYSVYPHELSGGQRQRIVIAQALIARPSLLVADEPTSALDTIAQADIIGLLKVLQERRQLSLIFITHNPALLSRLADKVLVMRNGRAVEAGSFEQIYWRPQDPYTQDLARFIGSLSGDSGHIRAI